ncbi:MAG: alanine--tRNA ligase [bacterium]|nr:alanine--tRNA ligase [bacterium]
MTGAQIREMFLKYFEERGHQRVPSSSLVPHNDPTLFFTNAGMVPFKDLFLGKEKRGYVRAVSTQKCMRVSGKHNDLENVGRTARHHTFFEMLGNFSFGDYFKEDAILFGWEFLTDTMGLDPGRLVVTVFTDDDEAHDLWRTVASVPENRIYRLGEKDNFWSMGETGPCGPCSEILIDLGEGTGCGTAHCGPDCDCGRFLELWNLVFMQYDRDAGGELHTLPKPSIDTGMGLERLAAVLQGKDSNYHTDLVFPFVEEAARISGVEYGTAEESDVSLRVIADHVRAVTFLVADGVLPSNEGRGYVLRRIMRRAARHGKLLGVDEPFLNRICPRVGDVLGDVFPELVDNMKTVRKVVHLEEERFGRTLDQGLARLSSLIGQIKGAGGSALPGDEVFRLYDTYGFPLDLSQDIAAESGIDVDVDGFNAEMSRQKERARAAWSGSGAEDIPQLFRDILQAAGPVTFTGYDEERTEGARITALAADDEVVESFTGDGDVLVILDRTPFYGESGGQAGDTGTLEGDGFRAEVLDTSKPLPGLTVHRCRLREGAMKSGRICIAEIDHDSRGAARRNHTATHLLHAALRQILGEHVQQAGSLVDPSRFRFDFTHFEALTDEQVRLVEDVVNRHVLENLDVRSRLMTAQEALDEGAMALFGEKYGDTVRVVSVPGVSMELCGGTHVNRTGDIGLFKVAQESGIAAGVRRVEGVTGTGIIDRLRAEEGLLREMAASARVSVAELPGRLGKLLSSIQEQEKKIRELMRSVSSGGGTDLESRVREVEGVRCLAAELPGQDAASLRDTADRVLDRIGEGIVVLATRDGDKAALIVRVSKGLTDRFSAGELVRKLAPVIGGGGGGRPDMAQAGGKKPDGLGQLIENVPAVIKEMTT